MYITGETKPKYGVRVGDYGNSEDGNGILGWIEPACANPQWILWFTKKGDAMLFTEREPSGAVVGEAIRLKAKGKNKQQAKD